jgi:hypothetical protein
MGKTFGSVGVRDEGVLNLVLRDAGSRVRRVGHRTTTVATARSGSSRGVAPTPASLARSSPNRIRSGRLLDIGCLAILQRGSETDRLNKGLASKVRQLQIRE